MQLQKESYYCADIKIQLNIHMCAQTLPGKLRDKEICDVEKPRLLPQSTVHKCLVVVQSAQALHRLFRVNHSLTYQLSLRFDILLPMFHVTALFYLLTALKHDLSLIWINNLIKCLKHKRISYNCFCIILFL